MDKIIKILLTCLSALLVGNLLLKYINYKLENLRTENVETKYTTMAERERQLECLARNIYFEAGKESFEGKVAVAQVTINRSESGIFPSDICKVIYQKNIFMERIVCQFSWYCEPQANKKVLFQDSYSECYAVAKKVLLEGFRLEILNEAMYYHANYVKPRWRKEKVAVIGNHIFYK